MIKTTTRLPAAPQGWMIETTSGQRIRLRDISQAGAFHFAKRYSAVWARPYTVLSGVTYVEV
jgi:hypothetical protein